MTPDSHLPTAQYEQQHPVLANPGETRLLEHLPQLDGVRAIAILMVLWFHFTPSPYRIPQGPAWGTIGVGLFFTLSGFLITRILLNCRLKIEQKRATLGQMFKQFYVRRILRIFPLYYAVILILVIFNPDEFRQRAGYAATYLTNIRMAYWQRSSGIERHLWSLSVEEQFYIAWPLLMFLCPRKLLLPLILCTIAVGPVWRYYHYIPKFLIHEWTTQACLDLLGAGALLAYLSLPQFGWARVHGWLIDLCGIIGLPLFFGFVATKSTLVHTADAVINAGSFWPGTSTYPITAVAAVWFIGSASRGFRGPIGWVLTWAPLVYVGRISYGLYVIHMLIPHAIVWLFPHSSFSHAYGWREFFILTTVSIAIASISWFGFEAPINRMKRYFEYDRTPRSTASTSPSISN